MWWVVIMFLIITGIAFFIIGALGIVIDPLIIYIVITIFLVSVGSVIAYFLYKRMSKFSYRAIDDLDESKEFAKDNFRKYEKEEISTEIPGKLGYSQIIKIPTVFGDDEFGAHLMYVTPGQRNPGMPVVVIVRTKPKPFKIMYKQRHPEASELGSLSYKYDIMPSTKDFQEMLLRGYRGQGKTLNIGLGKKFFSEEEDGQDER